MEKVLGFLKDYFKKKNYGFYITVAVAVLTLVTLIVYQDSYGSNARYMSWTGFAIMIVGLVVAVGLSVVNLGEFAAPAIALSNFIGLMLYIKNIYNYVVVVMVGIDIANFSVQFITCTTLFAILIVISIANIFFKQERKEVEA